MATVAALNFHAQLDIFWICLFSMLRLSRVYQASVLLRTYCSVTNI